MSTRSQRNALVGAHLDGSDVTVAQLRSANVDDTTELPDGIKLSELGTV